MIAAIDRTFESIAKDDTASFTYSITEEHLASFVALSGDMNPLHTDSAYAATTSFKKPIVHGMFLTMLCSRLVGMYLPGKRSVYVHQECFFKHPVYVGDTVTVTGVVTHTSAATRMVEMMIHIQTAEEIVFSGTAHVRILP